ncbi:MAG: magnesium chelatase subunit I [Sphingobacteriales bacterium]|jgi:magnesium chelatase subunit I
MTVKKQAATLGELKKSGYQSKSVKNEIRDNLILKLKSGEPVFDGVLGYEDTVIPQVERAILAGHNINFLGLRGQAKTRMARKMVGLLDEFIPIVAGSEINDDPLRPLSRKSIQLIEKLGDKTPIEWIHRDTRYTEKLATPDVNVADLIGDIDPIKAANLKLSFSDEEVIHFGLIPRSNRGIFVINELPDLQPRIQVSLFNILQEGDIQIRGFKLRFPLDVQFLFTANPEDYTNRGAIITPLKDRIQSQIFTHYPQSPEIGMEITRQEAKISETQKKIVVPYLIERLVEQIAQEARVSEFVDEKSGVSARLSISALESVVSAVERRMLINNEKTGTARISDLNASVPAIVGKIEMVYEGEQEGASSVAHKLIGAAIRTLSSNYFPGIENVQKKNAVNAKEKFAPIIAFFEDGNNVDLGHDVSAKDYEKELKKIKGLKETVESLTVADGEGITLLMEFLLHALAEYSLLDRKVGLKGYKFQDYFSSIIGGI